MTREIKFRAWDNIGKMMMPEIRNLILPHKKEYGSTLMQFTGLKDKNGVEIYEGDILKNGGLIGVIEFGDFDCDTGFQGHEEDFETIQAYYIKSKNGYKYSIYGEIIGNIYESKHLLDNTDTKV